MPALPLRGEKSGLGPNLQRSILGLDEGATNWRAILLARVIQKRGGGPEGPPRASHAL